MIVIKVELHSAITRKVSEIGRLNIYNDGTGTLRRGNYVAELCRRGSRQVLRRGEVLNHARLSAPVWSLLAKALEAVGF